MKDLSSEKFDQFIIFVNKNPYFEDEIKSLYLPRTITDEQFQRLFSKRVPSKTASASTNSTATPKAEKMTEESLNLNFKKL